MIIIFRFGAESGNEPLNPEKTLEDVNNISINDSSYGGEVERSSEKHSNIIGVITSYNDKELGIEVDENEY